MAPALAEDAPAAPAIPDMQKLGDKVYNLVAKGQLSDNVYDPSTPEGARALGLAFPVPKLEELEQVQTYDVIPVLWIFVLAVGWGLFVVPNVMTRSDGTETVYFPEKRVADPIDPEKAPLALTEIVETKRLPSGDTKDTKSASSKFGGTKGTKSVSSKKKKARVAGFKKR